MKMVVAAFCICVSSQSFGLVSKNFEDHDANQTGQQNFYTAYEEATGTQSNIYLGTKIAVGYKVACPTSIDGIRGSVISDYTFDPVTAYVADTHQIIGWSNYDYGSTNYCGFSWQWAMGPISSSISGNVGTIGVGWSMSDTDQASNGQDDMPVEKLGEEDYADADPLVIDLNGNGMRFTSLTEGVLFDLDADGILESVSWTERGVDDSFLFIDLNENGIADDGAELFTNYTAYPALLRAGFAKATVDSLVPWLNGYDALAMLDKEELRGNGDGMVSNADFFYRDLYLWNDRDHNGYSDEDEVILLTDTGIKALSLDLEYVNLYDEHGNWIEFTSWASTKSPSTKDKDKGIIYQTADAWFHMDEIYP